MCKQDLDHSQVMIILKLILIKFQNNSSLGDSRHLSQQLTRVQSIAHVLFEGKFPSDNVQEFFIPMVLSYFFMVLQSTP